jgi:hypothetical protein
MQSLKLPERTYFESIRNKTATEADLTSKAPLLALQVGDNKCSSKGFADGSRRFPRYLVYLIFYCVFRFVRSRFSSC